ncbi:hypothetical protein KXD40_004778 [Peronospora effusa]|nr:hypothetical protein KXD40_004778 [Peronospora effusa]
MRLRSTLLLAAAVAIVNTNYLVDGAVEERRLGFTNFLTESHTKFANHANQYDSMAKMVEEHQIETLKEKANINTNKRLFKHFFKYYDDNEIEFLKQIQKIETFPEPEFLKEFRQIFFIKWKKRGLVPDDVEAIAGQYWAFLYRRDMK